MTIVGFATGFVRSAWRWLSHALQRNNPNLPIPRRSLIVLPPTGHESGEWSTGTRRGTPATVLRFEFQATNVSRYDILIAGAKLKRPARFAGVFVKDTSSEYYGGYAIPPGQTTRGSAHFWVEPAFLDPGEEHRTDVALIDQFGNRHWIRRVRFKPRTVDRGN